MNAVIEALVHNDALIQPHYSDNKENDLEDAINMGDDTTSNNRHEELGAIGNPNVDQSTKLDHCNEQ